MNYVDPPWAKPPPKEFKWKVTEIKNGVEVASHELTKATTTFGKAGVIATLHESCSRLHARIAFDQRGVPWLRDLESTHGTTINKKAMPKISTGRRESMSTKAGARGVVIYPGDLIQFGASTRLFCVEGPLQFDRGAIKVMEQQHKKLATQTSDSSAHEEKVEGAAFATTTTTTTEEETEQDKNAQPQTLNESTVPPQYRKEWEVIKARRYKLQNLTKESQRIEAKGGLTEGQEKHLRKNTEHQWKLQGEISSLEKDLLEKVFPGSIHKMKALFSAANDEDDVDDRTNDNRSSTWSDGPETEASLVAKWKDFVRQYMDYGAAVAKNESRVKSLNEQIEMVDGEDAFFLKNDLNLAKDTLERSESKRNDANDSIDEVEKLLKIVNPKLMADRERGLIGLSLPSVKAIHPDSNHSSPGVQTERATGDNEAMMPPPAKRPTHKNVPPPMSLGARSKVLPPEIVPPPARMHSALKRPSNQIMPPPVMPPPPPVISEAKRLRLAKPTGTLAFLHQAPARIKNAPPKEKVVPSFDSQKDEWQAPEGQDGSGRTKLNAKFEGRY